MVNHLKRALYLKTTERQNVTTRSAGQSQWNSSKNLKDVFSSTMLRNKYNSKSAHFTGIDWSNQFLLSEDHCSHLCQGIKWHSRRKCHSFVCTDQLVAGWRKQRREKVQLEGKFHIATARASRPCRVLFGRVTLEGGLSWLGMGTIMSTMTTMKTAVWRRDSRSDC